MILSYLDRLSTYEVRSCPLYTVHVLYFRRSMCNLFFLFSFNQEILGGGRAAEQGYDDKFFRKFRSQSPVEAITDYARVRNNSLCPFSYYSKLEQLDIM